MTSSKARFSRGRRFYYDGRQISYVDVFLRAQIHDPDGLDLYDALTQREKLQLDDVTGTRAQGPDARIGAEAEDVGDVDHGVLLHHV
ncbi:hypothetical protein OCS_06809 [Ophiocordyceps sinensis CO18]|uniref:Uncharacterized protein n=1 Tax=Ophiocordyceps sinensis (strain Co18 / CGMCC 3.14243) TaxID=911162 RepID=T4ZWK2_OPHSC|nr:hypothetical protein OCS_06809 [Ophiocordyceps sinensis CO18]